jgi:O-antigen/teichoic acid export membrane protein
LTGYFDDDRGSWLGLGDIYAMTLARHAMAVPRIPLRSKWFRSGRHARPRDPLILNSAYLMAATMVTSLLGYVFWTVAARLYPAAAIGEAGAGVSAMAFASLLGALGGSMAILAELPSKRRPSDWSATVTAALVFTCATSAVTALVTVVVLAQTGHSAFLYRDGWWVAAFVVGVVATTASQLLENIWVAERQAGWFLGASTVFAVVKLAIVAVPAFVVFGATGILSAWSAVLAATVAGCLLVLGHKYGYRPRLAGFSQQIWSMRQTLTGNYVISVGDQVTLYVIPVLVALQVSPDAAGWFYVAWKIGGFYAVFASAVGTSTFAEGSHFPHRALPMALSGMKMILPFMALGAAVTIFAGHLVLRVFGAGYAAHAYLLLVLLSLAAFPDAVVSIYRSVLRVQKRYRTASAICWAISASRLALTALAVARWGIVGAGWAWLATQTGGAVWCALDLAWHSGSSSRNSIQVMKEKSP